MARRGNDSSGPAVPIGGGVPVDPHTGERFGYLPRKAARRKIIIRRTLGVPWIVGALAAAALIAVAGVAFLLSDPGRPASRFEDAGALSAYPAGEVTALSSGVGWVDRRAGVRVWLTTEPFCDSDGGWGLTGPRWDSSGRSTAAQGNLAYAETQLAGGRLFVDAARTQLAVGRPPVALGPCRGSRPVSR
ncbi:MAG: hypothetical protein ABIM89_12170 [Mycobacteriales bacterium]